ncbi:class I SAM-dependent methyltransferase [Streptomyces sp. H10-C2]|uniref:class I SAM-dependent methyltransferase n=1 Tax=unclassified Streptomyces TaxID=2593676 RepID=UPI0024B9A2C3|nr:MULTISPECIES: class I SAM-dependent methyltransferase [unclassified Streptomyces]MDJ0342614.1 class I SAM-dependent methyltransferase [Streptomyces sp. PH10-H1]MDJ0368532.1 class I SAM-dependent methyltransferase [Streptomyces sp. H10-C2]
MYTRTPEDWREANRARWDERVPIHTASEYYDLDSFRAGQDVIRPFEAAEVGSVTGKSLLHLQCHIGLDTLSWSRCGASRVVGLDFSEPAIEAARDLAADLGLTPDQASFVAADVYDAAEAVPDSSYDIVYTGTGALCWLPDMGRWAETAASLVAPGGFLYLAEFHPLTDALDDATGSRIAHDYFGRDAWVDEAPGTYADYDAPTVNNRSIEWQHTLGEVVTAIAATGLRLEFLHEHDATLFRRFETLERGAGGEDRGDGFYRLPPGSPRVPLMYSLRASRPADG